MKLKFRRKYSIAFVAAVLLVLLGSAVAFGQSSAFTYQGRLTDGGTPANGNYDLQFALFDSLSGGTQIGSTQTVNIVAVSNGVFSVTLDFGANSFNGASQFLEISARPSGAGSFILLTPRQQVTSTPYAVRSASAGNADTATNATNATTATNATQLGGIAASQYTQTNDSRLSDARPPTAGSSNYIQTNPSAAQNASFNISGNGTVIGTLSASRFNIGSARVLSMTGSGVTDSLFLGAGAGLSQTVLGGNIFVGQQAGLNNINGIANTFLGNNSGLETTSGSSNVFFGGDAGISNMAGGGNTFLGRSAGFQNTTGQKNTAVGLVATVGSAGLSNATAIGANAEVDQDNSLVLGSINGVNGATADTNVGIGTTRPQRALQIGASIDALFTFEGSNATPNAGYIRFGDNTGWKLHFGRSRQTSGGQLNSGTTGVLMTIQDNGSVGIGTTVPDATLTVNGTADKLGGGSWATFSDERLKNLKGRFTPGLKAVMQLQPLRYEYKRDNALNLKSEGEHIGFSAQAVQKIIPEAVTKNDKGYLLVNNDPILWTMLNAIKEQQAQIATLNARLRSVQRALRRKSSARRRR